MDEAPRTAPVSDTFQRAVRESGLILDDLAIALKDPNTARLVEDAIADVQQTRFIDTMAAEWEARGDALNGMAVVLKRDVQQHFTQENRDKKNPKNFQFELTGRDLHLLCFGINDIDFDVVGDMNVAHIRELPTITTTDGYVVKVGIHDSSIYFAVDQALFDDLKNPAEKK